ncbi:MAG: hypothetical protein U5L96_02190 [Owenweeksia sp.]|nr:hypothetical protein [Owenweeksia sp.]
MQKVLRNTSLFLALSLMMLHNIVPHQHHSDLDTDQHCLASDHQQDDLLDLLSDLFHVDLGGDHLENLRGGESTKVFTGITAILVDDAPVIAEPRLLLDEKPAVTAHNLPLPKRISITLRSLRSPPFTIQA